MTMDSKKRVMVGAIIHIVLILLLLLFMSQCLSFSAHHAHAHASSINDTMISRLNNVTISASSHLSRRMLGGRRPAGSSSNSTSYRIADDKHNVDADTSQLIHGSKGSFNMTVSSNAPDVNQGDRLQVPDECPPSSPRCANNATSIDPRYGVEKRLVPTGPNPLHN